MVGAAVTADCFSKRYGHTADVYEHRNMVSAKIANYDGDGYIGEADNVKVSVKIRDVGGIRHNTA